MTERPLRILVGADVPPDPNSGAAGTVFATNAALRRLGHEVEAFWSRDLSHRVSHGNLHYFLELPYAYRAAVTQRCLNRQFDVIQLSQPHAWLTARDHHKQRRKGIFINRSHGLEDMADTATSYWHKRLGIPENRFPRLLFTSLIRRRLHHRIGLVVRHADGLIVPASDIREHLVEHYSADPERVAVIHHGAPDAFLQRPLAPMTTDRTRRLLFVGQYAFIKGPHLLAQVIEKVFSIDTELTLTWVCAHQHHHAVRALFRPEFQKRILLKAWMTQDALIELYDQHGIFVAHSLYEGAAKASSEAMARGLVVVTSRVGALKDHINHGQNGFLVEVGDTDAMAEIVCRLSSNSDEVKKTANRSRVSVNHLSWENCAQQAVDFYQKLL